VEIANNLGMVYLKLGEFHPALNMFSATLGLSPGRSSAWANLAEYFALQGKPEQAVPCYALAFHFSQNQDKTRNFLQQRASSADSPQVRQAAQQALQLSLIQGGSAGEDSLDAPLPAAPPVAAAPSVVAPAPVPPPVAAQVTPHAAPATPPMASVPSAPAEAPPQAPMEPIQPAQNAVPSPGNASTGGVQTVVSEGLGTDVPSAAQNAAQNALTNVVGSFIDSTKELEKRVEIKEGIRSQTSRIDTNVKEYSQGSIQRFEILATSEQGGLVKVTAKVTVRVEDFKAYIKNLAEGQTTLDGGLFGQLVPEKNQKENLEKIIIDLITPIAKGEVLRFEVGKPVSLEEGKKAIDELYSKIKDKFGDRRNDIENHHRQLPRHIDEFSKKYGSSRVLVELGETY